MKLSAEELNVLPTSKRITAAQRREIEEMEWLINDINEHGIASTEAEANERPVPDFEASP